jgi:hypothetical protein
VRFFFELHNTSETLTTHAHSSLWIHARKPYPYEHLRRLCRQIPKIDEVTTGASLSTGTSPTTESTNAVKSWEIRSHRESNPGPKMLPRLLEPLGYRPFAFIRREITWHGLPNHTLIIHFFYIISFMIMNLYSLEKTLIWLQIQQFKFTWQNKTLIGKLLVKDCKV